MTSVTSSSTGPQTRLWQYAGVENTTTSGRPRSQRLRDRHLVERRRRRLRRRYLGQRLHVSRDGLCRPGEPGLRSRASACAPPPSPRLPGRWPPPSPARPRCPPTRSPPRPPRRCPCESWWMCVRAVVVDVRQLGFEDPVGRAVLLGRSRLARVLVHREERYGEVRVLDERALGPDHDERETASARPRCRSRPTGGGIRAWRRTGKSGRRRIRGALIRRLGGGRRRGRRSRGPRCRRRRSR